MSEPLPHPHPSDATLDVRWVDRWIAGTCAPDDTLAISAWLDAQPGRRLEMERVREKATQVFAYPTVTAPEVVWERLRPSGGGEAKQRQHQKLGNQTLGKRIGGLRIQRLWNVFSAAGIMAAIAATYFLVTSPTRRQSDVSHTYATQAGQQGAVTLPDGTHVILAPNTTLRLQRFGASSRTVDLDGQAYFEVPHSGGTPFVVRTRNVATEVLGTAFFVRHYAYDTSVHVAVAQGKVNVVATGLTGHLPTMSRVLTVGQVGDAIDSTILTNTVGDLTSDTDWLSGRLVFRHVPVGQVLQTLGRWYGYQFRCDDSTLKRYTVTLALDARSSAAALSTLGRLLDVHLEVVGDTVTLTPNVVSTHPGISRTRAYDVWIPTREVGR